MSGTATSTGAADSLLAIGYGEDGSVSEVELVASGAWVKSKREKSASFSADLRLANGARAVRVCLTQSGANGRSAKQACIDTIEVDVDCGPPEPPPATDSTPPSIVATRTPEPNASGWNNSDVTVSFACEDTDSGVAYCSPEVIVSSEGEGQSVTGEARDHAGNTATATVSSINIDNTAPSVRFDGAREYLVDETVSVLCHVSDALSGVSQSTCADVVGEAYTFELGDHALAAAATDRADNVTEVEATFSVRVTAGSLCNLVERWVSHRGVANSLCVKLENSARAAERGQAKTASNVLDAFANELSAQTGKKVSAESAAILMGLSEALKP